MVVNEDFTKLSKLADVGRWFINNFVKAVAAEIPAGAKVLDAGAGECVYKKYFAHCHYKSVDLAVGNPDWAYESVDYIAPLDQLPLDDSEFDAVLCTQVLEHLEHPLESLKEFCRVLKPGGRLYLTAPMAHVEHQVPYDFFRYTSFGLQSMISRAGFNQIEICPFGGMFTRWAYELPRVLAIFPTVRSLQGMALLKGIVALPLKVGTFVAIRLLQRGLLLLEPLDRSKNDPFGWSVTATKN